MRLLVILSVLFAPGVVLAEYTAAQKDRAGRIIARRHEAYEDRVRVASFYDDRGNRIRARNAVRSDLINRGMVLNRSHEYYARQIFWQNVRRPVYLRRGYGRTRYTTLSGWGYR